MRALIVILVLFAAAAYLAWRQPEVRELFQSSEKKREDPLAVLQEKDEELAEARARQRAEEEAEEERRQAASPAPRRNARRGESASAPQAVPAAPSVPNAEVARVLRQVFAAKKIGQEIQMGVSNTLVELSGTVKSETELREILRLIEKARETRRVDASDVTVRP